MDVPNVYTIIAIVFVAAGIAVGLTGYVWFDFVAIVVAPLGGAATATLITSSYTQDVTIIATISCVAAVLFGAIAIGLREKATFLYGAILGSMIFKAAEAYIPPEYAFVQVVVMFVLGIVFQVVLPKFRFGKYLACASAGAALASMGTLYIFTDSILNVAAFVSGNTGDSCTDTACVTSIIVVFFGVLGVGTITQYSIARCIQRRVDRKNAQKLIAEGSIPMD